MNRLKELRNQRKLTLDDIERKTGIKRGTYSNYENNKTEPKLATWQKLADFFKVSVPYVQGLTYSIDEIIKVINDAYIDKEEDLYDSVNEFVFLTNSSILDIDDMYDYYDEIGAIPTKKAKEFWINNFGFIINSYDFQNFLKSSNKKYDEDIEPIDAENIKEMFIEKLVFIMPRLRDKYYLTDFGKLYKKKYEMKEKNLHANLIDKLKYLDLPSIKKALNRYLDLMNKVSEDVNGCKIDTLDNGDKEKYIDQYFYQRYYSNWDEVYEKDVERYEIGVEIANRVDKGDKQLQKYIIDHDNKDFISAYRDYKEQKGEDTKKIDDYFKTESKAYLSENNIHLD